MLKEYRGFQHIYLRYGYTDLRLGVDGLAALIRQELRLNPFAPNTLYLFCGRRSDRIKCLTYASHMKKTAFFCSTNGLPTDPSAGHARRRKSGTCLMKTFTA